MLRRFSDKTRRSVLIDVSKILRNDTDLKRYAGKNALLDCSLYLMAKDDETLLNRLNKYINTDELLTDVKHVNDSMKLRKYLGASVE